MRDATNDKAATKPSHRTWDGSSRLPESDPSCGDALHVAGRQTSGSEFSGPTSSSFCHGKTAPLGGALQMVEARKHLRKPPAKSRAVRKIPRSSKGHFVGELGFKNGAEDQRLGWGSLTEHDVALCFIYRPDFMDLEEQLAGLPFTLPNGKLSHHYFDFRFTQKGGRKICISVKPESIAVTYRYRAKIGKVRKAAVGNICDAVLTVTERNIDPVKLHNAKLFHAARNVEPELDEVILYWLKKLSQPTSINDFLAGAGIGGHGFFSVARAIRFGHARLFTPGKIRGTTLIENGRAD